MLVGCIRTQTICFGCRCHRFWFQKGITKDIGDLIESWWTPHLLQCKTNLAMWWKHYQQQHFTLLIPPWEVIDLLDASKNEPRLKQPVDRRFIVMSIVIMSDGFRIAAADADRARWLGVVVVNDLLFLKLLNEDLLFPSKPGDRYIKSWFIRMKSDEMICVIVPYDSLWIVALLLHQLAVVGNKPAYNEASWIQVQCVLM